MHAGVKGPGCDIERRAAPSERAYVYINDEEHTDRRKIAKDLKKEGKEGISLCLSSGPCRPLVDSSKKRSN
jgi:hypothetical protein